MKRKYLLVIGLTLIANLFGVSAQVYKALYVEKAGTMNSQITEEEANAVTNLTVVGKINAIDFKSLRDGFPNLAVLDISNVDVKFYSGKNGTHSDKFYMYPMNSIPAYAFCRLENGIAHGKLSLRKVILSEKTIHIEDGAFEGCSNLRICKINRKKAPNLFENALSDTVTAIFIPFGTKDEYRLKKRWENFAFIESEPIEAKLQIGIQGSLKNEIQAAGLQPANIHFLTIEGKLDVNDFKLITDNMPNLVSIDIENTTTTALPDFVFAQKKYMLRIKLPQGLKTIGQRAFSGCGRLSGALILPPNVTSIEYGAFLGCDNLHEVIVTGNQLTTIGENLFGNVSKIKYEGK